MHTEGQKEKESGENQERKGKSKRKTKEKKREGCAEHAEKAHHTGVLFVLDHGGKEAFEGKTTTDVNNLIQKPLTQEY